MAHDRQRRDGQGKNRETSPQESGRNVTFEDLAADAWRRGDDEDAAFFEAMARNTKTDKSDN